MSMMIPYPYDFIASWEKKHNISLTDEARQELVEALGS